MLFCFALDYVFVNYSTKTYFLVSLVMIVFSLIKATKVGMAGTLICVLLFLHCISIIVQFFLLGLNIVRLHFLFLVLLYCLLLVGFLLNGFRVH